MSKIGVQEAYQLGRDTALNGQSFETLDFMSMTDIEFELAEKGYKSVTVVCDPSDLEQNEDLNLYNDNEEGPEELDFN